MRGTLPQGSHILSKRRLLQDPSAALIYALIIFFFLVPSLKHAGRYMLAGGEGDTYMSLMNNLFVADSLKTGNFFGSCRSGLINPPEGYMIFSWLVDPGCPMLSAVLSFFAVGHIAVYNIVQLFNLLFLAFFIYRLSMHFFKDFFLSLCAGAASLYSMPFLGASWDGLFDVTFLYLIPLLLILHFKFESRTATQGILFGCAAAAATLFNATFVYFVMLFTGFDGLLEILSKKQVKDTLRYLIIVWIIVGMAVFIRFHFQPRSNDTANLSGNDYIRTAGDLFRVNPGYSQKQFLSLATVLYPFDASKGPEDNMPFSHFDGTCYFGLHLLLFGAAGMALFKFSGRYRLFKVFILFFIISLGPYLTWIDNVGKISVFNRNFIALLPYAFIVKLVPLLKYVRHISRLSYIVYYFLIIFSVYGAYALAGLRTNKRGLKYAAAACWTLIHIFSTVCLFPDLTPLHPDRKEYSRALQAISKEPGARVGYIDPGLSNSFPRVNNRNLIIFTAAIHDKQSIIMNTEAKALMYYCLRDKAMSEENLRVLEEQLTGNSIKYIILLKVTDRNTKDYSRHEKEVYYPAISLNLNRLFTKIYAGSSYDIFDAGKIRPYDHSL